MDNRIELIKERIKSNSEEIEYFQGLIKRIENKKDVGFSNELDIVENCLFSDIYDLKHREDFYYIKDEPKALDPNFFKKLHQTSLIVDSDWQLNSKKEELKELLYTVKNTLKFTDENRSTLQWALYNFQTIVEFLISRDPIKFKEVSDTTNITDAETSIKVSYKNYRDQLIQSIEMTISCL